MLLLLLLPLQPLQPDQWATIRIPLWHQLNSATVSISSMVRWRWCKSNNNAQRFRLVSILKDKDLLTVVSQLPPPSTPDAEASTATAAGKALTHSPELSEFKINDNKAFTIITLYIKDLQVPHIQQCTMGKETWDSPSRVHQGIGTIGRMIHTMPLWSLLLGGYPVAVVETIW